MEEPHSPRSLCPSTATLLFAGHLQFSDDDCVKCDKFYMGKYMIKMSNFFHAKSTNSYLKKSDGSGDKHVFSFHFIKNVDNGNW